ncbi:MAG: cytochrome C [Alphaproteobacteria bacterium]|nr:MAG: cytochrome C [Alphaproteobacteria bacterium]
MSTPTLARRLAALLAAGSVLAAAAAPVFAEGRIRPITDKVTAEECGACHMPYPAGFLPAQSWKRIMATLDNHFGEDASLDPDTAKHITNYLVRNAARWRNVPSPAPMRITELGWFQRQHRRAARIIQQHPEYGVTSLAQCQECHRGAERGYFEDE